MKQVFASRMQGSFELVQPPRATRKLAVLLVIVFVSAPVLLLLIPWLQNVPATGRVTALDPLDRTQMIPAPVTGRLVKLHVQEGAYVERDDLLAEMADQDPDFAARLEQQFEFSQDSVRAARDQVAFYDQQLILLEDAREQAISGATFDLNVAIEKVRSVEQDLVGLEAELEQKRLDFQRKSNLNQQDVVSDVDFQKAEAEYLSARAAVDSAKAKVNQARNEELAKMAKVEEVAAEQQAKIRSTQSIREEARAKLADAEKAANEATTRLERQKTQVIYAPRAGYVQRVHAANSADLLTQGDPLIELVPETEGLVAELWVRGLDAPLITPGRKVRLQFEGWPAVQFAGWPSVAVGTFGGVVGVIDAYASADGTFRVLVLPDPDDEPWPPHPYLRQGGRANGWLLLDSVSLGYEVWRQLNAFPPTLRDRPEKDGQAPASSAKSKPSMSKGGA